MVCNKLRTLRPCGIVTSSREGFVVSTCETAATACISAGPTGFHGDKIQEVTQPATRARRGRGLRFVAGLAEMQARVSSLLLVKPSQFPMKDSSLLPVKPSRVHAKVSLSRPVGSSQLLAFLQVPRGSMETKSKRLHNPRPVREEVVGCDSSPDLQKSKRVFRRFFL